MVRCVEEFENNLEICNVRNNDLERILILFDWIFNFERDLRDSKSIDLHAKAAFDCQM